MGTLLIVCSNCGTTKRLPKRNRPQPAPHASLSDSVTVHSKSITPEYDKFISPRNAKSVVMIEKGMASWYGPNFDGMLTADGEIFNMHGLTAAHRTLPFNTLVLVKNTSNGKSVVVRITDRGPFSKNRIIDLSKKAAKKIGMLKTGVASVKLYVAKKALEQADSTNLAMPAFTIQLGSFINKNSAHHLAHKIKGSRVEIVQINDQFRYRVYYGLYTTKQDARQALKEMKKNYKSCFIRRIENH
jgi:rare lipoprotein A